MLKDERFRLGMSDRDINLSNIAYEGARFLAIYFFTKVAWEALFEIFGFAT